MLPVSKNVPLPPIRRSGSQRAPRSAKYPLETMAVGEMFVVAPKSVTSRSITAYVSTRGVDLGRTFATRRIVARHVDDGSWAMCEEDDIGATPTVGVWRIK